MNLVMDMSWTLTLPVPQPIPQSAGTESPHEYARTLIGWSGGVRPSIVSVPTTVVGDWSAAPTAPAGRRSAKAATPAAASAMTASAARSERFRMFFPPW
jgi:hypothetical protein